MDFKRNDSVPLSSFKIHLLITCWQTYNNHTTKIFKPTAAYDVQNSRAKNDRLPFQFEGAATSFGEGGGGLGPQAQAYSYVLPQTAYKRIRVYATTVHSLARSVKQQPVTQII